MDSLASLVPHTASPPHLDLLPGLAVHFCFLLRPGVRVMAYALSLLLRWQLFAYN